MAATGNEILTLLQARRSLVLNMNIVSIVQVFQESFELGANLVASGGRMLPVSELDGKGTASNAYTFTTMYAKDSFSQKCESMINNENYVLFPIINSPYLEITECSCEFSDNVLRFSYRVINISNETREFSPYDVYIILLGKI